MNKPINAEAESDIEPVYLDRFVCVDVDRCVLRSTTFFRKYVLGALQQIAKSQCRSHKELALRQKVIETVQYDESQNVGKAFDFMAVYNRRVDNKYQVDPDDMAKLIVDSNSQEGILDQKFIDDVVAEGTFELIDKLEVMENSDWAFLTSGGITTQWIKLHVLSIILWHEKNIMSRAQVVTTENKARDIDTLWRQEDGLFRVPDDISGQSAVITRQVVVLDDKLKNLVSENSHNIISIQIADPELRVTKDKNVKSLVQAIELLNNIDN